MKKEDLQKFCQVLDFHEEEKRQMMSYQLGISGKRSSFFNLSVNTQERKKTTSTKTDEKYPSSEWLTAKEVVKILGISERTFQNMRNQRRIPFSQPTSRKIYVKRSDLNAFMEANYIKAR